MPSACNISIKDIQMAMEVFNMQQKPAKTQEEAMQKPYQFWNTQPVPKMGKSSSHMENFILMLFFFSKLMTGFQMKKLYVMSQLSPIRHLLEQSRIRYLLIFSGIL